jgi:hypothetical protein
VESYGFIVIEALQLDFILRSDKLAHATYDTALGMFGEILNHKAFEVAKVNLRITIADVQRIRCDCPKRPGGWRTQMPR